MIAQGKSKRKPPDNPNPRALAYARVSTDPQAESGLGLASQDLQALAYYDDVLRPRGIAQYLAFIDESATAFKRDLARREAGGRLDAAAVAGDHIVVPLMDRGFRGLRDYVNQVDRWRNRGVFVHVLDTRLDTSDEKSLAFMMMVAQMRAVIAEYESHFKAQRIRDINVIRRQRGRSLGVPPVGWLAVGPLKARMLAPNEPERETMMLIVRMRESGMGFASIATALAKQRIMYKKPDSTAKLGYRLNFWSTDRCERGYRNMLDILAKQRAGETPDATP